MLLQKVYCSSSLRRSVVVLQETTLDIAERSMMKSFRRSRSFPKRRGHWGSSTDVETDALTLIDLDALRRQFLPRLSPDTNSTTGLKKTKTSLKITCSHWDVSCTFSALRTVPWRQRAQMVLHPSETYCCLFDSLGAHYHLFGFFHSTTTEAV